MVGTLDRPRKWIDSWTDASRYRGGFTRWRRLRPTQLLVGSFLVLIAIGTLGLMLLPGLYTGERLGWLDALFTATSAVCVTGLIVVDTATYFTLAGQAWLLLLIQLGGLGIITFTTLIILAVGGRLSLRTESLASVADIAPEVEYRHLARGVVLYTALFETAGALLLYLFWIPRLGWTGGVWPALFHSISAFCNAGFSTFTDSLMGFQRSYGALLVVMALVVVGGLGFLTIEELYLNQKHERQGRKFRLSLHSRLVLGTTAALVFGAWPLLASMEWTNILAGMPLPAKLVNSLFLSVTPRTAGFNTVDYAETTDATNFFTIVLMSIGGSPGSTAGGLKTTTVALLALLAWSRVRGTRWVTVGGRTVPDATIQRAIGLFVIGFVVVTAAIMVLVAVQAPGPATEEAAGFLPFMFESVSAFNTVGLSMGVTSDLSATGRWIAIGLMYLGRIGPLTLAAAIAIQQRAATRELRYAYEDVIVG
jgi:trk system potassium uptake protein TrkH